MKEIGHWCNQIHLLCTVNMNVNFCQKSLDHSKKSYRIQINRDRRTYLSDVIFILCIQKIFSFRKLDAKIPSFRMKTRENSALESFYVYRRLKQRVRVLIKHGTSICFHSRPLISFGFIFESFAFPLNKNNSCI